MNEAGKQHSGPEWSAAFWEALSEGNRWRQRVVVGSDAAAGAEQTVTVVEGRLWLLHSIRFRLVASATAATRAVGLVLDDGTNVFFEAAANQTQLASETQDYTFSTAGEGKGFATARASGVLPNPCPLLRGYRIRTVTTNLQAGDNFGAPVLLIAELMER